MQRSNGIGKDWANKTLRNGYQSDNKNPSVTTAKVFNKETKQLEEVVLEPGNTYKFKGKWKGDMIRYPEQNQKKIGDEK